ncbi:hypothetical protein MBLNU230_g2494t1 [Neophaeotheca triangularis]
MAKPKNTKPTAKPDEKFDVMIRARKNTEAHGKHLDSEGNIILAENIPRATLSRFIYELDTRTNSQPPFDRPPETDSTGSSNKERRVVWLSTWIDEEAARFIMAWILREADSLQPSPLPCPDDFNLAVSVHRAAKVFNLVREVRGELVRENLMWYIRNMPLTYSEFAMLMEHTDWDGGLTMTAKRSIVSLGRGRVPEFDSILEYCAETGLMVSMVELGLQSIRLGNANGNGNGGHGRKRVNAV